MYSHFTNFDKLESVQNATSSKTLQNLIQMSIVKFLDFILVKPIEKEFDDKLLLSESIFDCEIIFRSLLRLYVNAVKMELALNNPSLISIYDLPSNSTGVVRYDDGITALMLIKDFRVQALIIQTLSDLLPELQVRQSQTAPIDLLMLVKLLEFIFSPCNLVVEMYNNPEWQDPLTLALDELAHDQDRE